MNAITKYRGSLKLSAIGDALGWITEFEKSEKSLKSKYNVSHITNFFDWEKKVGGRFYGYTDFIKSGSYSDDTQLALSVARSIQTDGTVDQKYFAEVELPNWLLYERGGGRTIKNAARKIQRKSSKWNNNFFKFKVGKNTIDYRDSGANGAAMRILPIVLANFGDDEKIREEIFSNSIITHGHPRAIIGAMLYGYSLNAIMRFKPENFNDSAFLVELGKDIHSKLSIPFIKNEPFKSWVEEWNSSYHEEFLEIFYKVVSESQEFLRQVYRALKNNISDYEILNQIGCYNSATRGSGISTVLAGIYFTCKYWQEPIKGIEKAVNSIGTDTDSIAAFTGGLLGALHGQNVIPQKWEKVQDIAYFDDIANHLLEISESRVEKNNEKEKNQDKVKNINYGFEDIFSENEKVYFEPLGSGIISKIDRQKTLTKGKYNLIIHVSFEIGQSCVFKNLLDVKSDIFKDNSTEFKMEYKNIDHLIDSLSIEASTKDKLRSFIEKLPSKKQEELIIILEEILNTISQNK